MDSIYRHLGTFRDTWLTFYGNIRIPFGLLVPLPGQVRVVLPVEAAVVALNVPMEEVFVVIDEAVVDLVRSLRGLGRRFIDVIRERPGFEVFILESGFLVVFAFFDILEKVQEGISL